MRLMLVAAFVCVVAVAAVAIAGAGPALKPGVYEATATETVAGTRRHPCDTVETKRLSVVIADDGAISWSGYWRMDGECDDGYYEPQSCWTRGAATLELDSKGRGVFAASDTSKTAGPAALSERMKWKCGAVTVVTDGEEPDRGDCVRIGRVAMPGADRLASIFCQANDTDFPELAKAKVRVRVGTIELALGMMRRPKRVKLKWTAPPPPTPPDAGADAMVVDAAPCEPRFDRPCR
jgi:hypothetical protein